MILSSRTLFVNTLCLIIISLACDGFSINPKTTVPRINGRLFSSWSAEARTNSEALTISTEAAALKESLLNAVREFRILQARDGECRIDFGVKGGEINATSRTPSTVNYYSISQDVGLAADKVIEICNQLAKVSPSEDPTKYLGDLEKGDSAPLHGAWSSLFTNAADASFSKNSTRGSAKVQTIVDGSSGRMTNVIDFDRRADGTEPALKQVKVVIQSKAVSPKRVELQFRYAKLLLTRFFFFPLFGRQLTLTIPVPQVFITRLIVFVGRILRFGKVTKVPTPYFDVEYLDSDLRVHKTGDNNLFVLAKESWQEAKSLLQ